LSSQSRNRNTNASKQKKAQGGSSSSRAKAPSGKKPDLGKNGSSGRSGKQAQAAATPPLRKPLLGPRVKNDLIGLVLIIVAVVLLVIVALPSDAFGARFMSQALRSVFGQGAFVLPFLILAWAATFFVRKRLTNAPVRLALGLGVIYLALIGIFAALTPQAVGDPGHIFTPTLLTSQGGYVGGALAWALLSLVGQVPTMILLVGLMLVGLVLIGLSLTGLVDWIIKGIRGAGRRDEGIPLPGAVEDDVSGEASAAPAQGGSAYQMGPELLGGTALGYAAAGKAAPAGAEGRQAGAGDALLQPTGVMGAAQLEHTLYRPGLDLPSEDEAHELPELGSARRRLSQWNANPEPDSRARTLLFDEDDIVLRARDASSPLDEGTALAASDTGEQRAAAEQDGVLGQAPNGSDTVVLPGADRGGPGRKRGRKSAGPTKTRASSSPAGTLSSAYVLPSMKLLRVSREKAHTKAGAAELRSTGNRLQETLEEFRVDGEVVGWIAGPTVTLYKISLGEGVRLNRVTALQSDIQLALAAQAIRIVAPIPGTSLVGIEIPNAARNEVLLGDVLDSARDSTLALAIGKDVEGESIVADLASMPHLLIGGTTGSGKSVAINSIIMSLLMRTTPDEVRMIMIDPKRVELTLYNGIPHLYVPVVTDAGQAASALAWCVAEMDRRLKLFEKHAVKNLKQFNIRVAENLKHLAESERMRRQSEDAQGSSGEPADAAGDDPDATGELDAASLQTLLLSDDDEPEALDTTVEQENLRATLPSLVIVIDELADLMMINGKEVEGAISRLAQLARAAGLHLVVATQRPSTNVITGLIKANIVNRIAFTVASGIDSRVILDTPGAEDLIGLGDMLFSRPEYSKPARIQGCLVSESEIETVVEYWRAQGGIDYHEEILLAAAGAGTGSGGFNGDGISDDDPLIWEAAEIVVASQLGSTSTLQRRLKVGYARAGRIMDMLEMKGVVGPPNGSKPREVLVDDVLDLETLRAYG
jgi:S-DNA-T family DNA segregation ATPase FtsK/SpoIIIE